MTTQISIGQVKRDISELINRVTYGRERIILTSRGKPKAALVSMQDYEQLIQNESRAADIRKWLAETRTLADGIEARRGEPIDVDAILNVSRHDLEQR
ncbi:MAG: type II toxin-antitoxin system Phd/YefM family antitoxin [Chloroflexota bacterium]|jgi:prevent-host-death family protein